MDIFTEQIVKRKFSGKDWAIAAGAVLLAMVLIYIGVFILLPLTMMPLIAVLVIGGLIYRFALKRKKAAAESVAEDAEEN